MAKGRLGLKLWFLGCAETVGFSDWDKFRSINIKLFSSSEQLD